MLRTRRIARTARVLIFAAVCSASDNAFADITIGDYCSAGAQSAQAGLGGNNAICVSNAWQYPAYQFGNSSASCNATNAGITKYASNHLYFCNSSAWTQLYEVATTPAVTAPAGHGYFVLTATSWNGNLGGLAGANAKCLTELSVTSTGWQGYSTANSNGQLVADKVHAALCESNAQICYNLMPLTTYYFANAGDGTAGGASFTTDSEGKGPGDSNAWNAANYFGGLYEYWLNRGSGSNTLWSNIAFSGVTGCGGNWSVGTSGSVGRVGLSSGTTSVRWQSLSITCDNTRRLICFVDP